MRLRTLVTLACLALVLTPLASLASDHGAGALDEPTIDVGALTEDGALDGNETTPGQTIIVLASVEVPHQNNTDWRAYLNTTVDDGPMQGNQTLISQGGKAVLPVRTTAPTNETETAQLAWTVTIQQRNQTVNASEDPANATANPWRTVDSATGTFTFSVATPTPPPGPGLPWTPILIIGAVVVAGGGAAYYWVTRDRQIRSHQPRSKAMAELEGDKYGGTTQADAAEEPEIHPQLKILEARAEDVRRIIELARDRHDRGDLTEHQFNTIRERKETELEEIEAEMEQYREG